MENTQRESLREEMLSKLLSTKEELQRSISHSGGTMLTATPFIISVDGLCVNPTVVNNRVEAGPLTIGLPNRVRRFSKENAEIIAPQVVNGHGHRGIAEFWEDAVVRKIDELDKAINLLTSM